MGIYIAMKPTLIVENFNGMIGSSGTMKQAIYVKMAKIMTGLLEVFKEKDRVFLRKLKNRTIYLPSEVKKVMYLYESVICGMVEE